MKQYCRYCAFCIQPDTFYCTALDKPLTSRKVMAVNNCEDFALSDAGDVETGQTYRPRERKVKLSDEDGAQLSFFEEES